MLKRNLLFTFAAAAFAVSGVAVAEEAKIVSAPFGLEWGQSKDDIRKLGVDFTRRDYLGRESDSCEDEGAYEYCITDSLPKNIPHLDSYRLAINPKYGLIEVLYKSDFIISDEDGSLAKSRYNEFKRLISAKYGTPFTDEYVNESHYKSDGFHGCLETEECGRWQSYWQPVDGGYIEFRIDPHKLVLFYVSPDYDKALQEHAKGAF